MTQELACAASTFDGVNVIPVTVIATGFDEKRSKGAFSKLGEKNSVTVPAQEDDNWDKELIDLFNRK